MDEDTIFYIASGADIKTTQARIISAARVLGQKPQFL